MNVTLTLLLVIIVLLVTIVAVAKLCRKLQEQNATYKKELSRAEQNTLYLYNHAEEIAEIQRQEKKVEAQIDGAKSDEEILNIINSIVDTNNNRVRKQTKG